ncbi:hypothetical protein VTK56DRAFT_3610 [Thermocarpiscus australiensis]
MLNDNGPAASPLSKPPQAPAQLQTQQQQAHPQPLPPSLPSTPVQANPQQSFRDYSQTQPSPGRHISQDYGAQHVPSGAFASPFQTAAPGPYPSRPPPPPPLQQIPSNELRSPSISGGPGPSPYRQASTPSISTPSLSTPSLSTPGGYPFPTQQTPTNTVPRHQYTPTNTYHSQPATPVGITGPPAAVPYMQGSHMPQGSSPGIAPTAHSYVHMPQSVQSPPTPTSAQSQTAQYGAPFVQGSPVATPRPAPQTDAQHRQSSQPPTPGGGVPLSVRPAQAVGYGQQPSPYQRRLPAASFHTASQAASPPPPPSSTQASVYDPHSQGPAPDPQQHRDRTISVSPKTRVSSLPSSSGRPSTSVSEPEPRPNQLHSGTPMVPTLERDTKQEFAAKPAKRKLQDRELRPEEMERRDVRPPPFEDANGRAAYVDGPVHNSLVPMKVQKKRKIYRTAPVWAQSRRDRVPPGGSRTLYQPVPHAGPPVNGKPLDRQPTRPDRQPSRHQSPEEKRPIAQPTPGSNAPPEVASQYGLLGPWEASITNSVPQEGFTKAVADFLFSSVILNPDIGEIQSRGVKFEIEAKLGTLINKETNQRISFPVVTECVINNGANWLGFRSSMTEMQHKSFNEFLNLQVQQAHPNNKANAALPRPRVPINYQHRREVDRFFELPPSVRDRVLPVCVAQPIASRGHGARVRVTHDLRTKEVLAKIIKARVADLSLHFPDQPLDCRISVNLEMDWDGAVEDLDRFATATTATSSSGRPPIPDRNKDRLSYRHGCYQIDLTQVTQMVPGPNNTQRQEKEHELEVEVDPVPLIDQGRRAMDGQPHQYVEVVEGLVNNIRILARKAREFGT